MPSPNRKGKRGGNCPKGKDTAEGKRYVECCEHRGLVFISEGRVEGTCASDIGNIPWTLCHVLRRSYWQWAWETLEMHRLTHFYLTKSICAARDHYITKITTSESDMTYVISCLRVPPMTQLSKFSTLPFMSEGLAFYLLSTVRPWYGFQSLKIKSSYLSPISQVHGKLISKKITLISFFWDLDTYAHRIISWTGKPAGLIKVYVIGIGAARLGECLVTWPHSAPQLLRQLELWRASVASTITLGTSSYWEILWPRRIMVIGLTDCGMTGIRNATAHVFYLERARIIYHSRAWKQTNLKRMFSCALSSRRVAINVTTTSHIIIR